MLKALVYEAPERFKVRDLPFPNTNPREVLIRVEACGICRTDMHIHSGRFISKFPLTPGHEFAGTVEKVGSEVYECKAGDRVTADNALPCGFCYFCRRNEPLYCENFYSLGCNGPGGFAEYVVVNSEKVFRIPDKLSFEEAVFTEPTACVVHCMDILSPKAGSSVLIFGAGPAGIILAQMVRHCGASTLVVAAPTESKLKMVRELTDADTVKIPRSRASDARERIMDFAQKGFDVVIDATGSSEIIEQCFDFVKTGGFIVIFGVPDEEATITIKPYEIYRREMKVIGTFAQTHCFERALDFISNGIIRVKELITHEFPLERYSEALNVLKNDREAMKVIIRP